MAKQTPRQDEPGHEALGRLTLILASVPDALTDCFITGRLAEHRMLTCENAHALTLDSAMLPWTNTDLVVNLDSSLFAPGRDFCAANRLIVGTIATAYDGTASARLYQLPWPAASLPVTICQDAYLPSNLSATSPMKR